MTVNDKTMRKLKAGCRLEKSEPELRHDFKLELFSRAWEVFVVKRDETTGKPVGKLACCALEPV
jgi:hypothetical protein